MISLQLNKTLNFNQPISLVSSKSISNRYLILGALSKNNIEIENLSNADDTKILQSALSQENNEINLIGKFTFDFIDINNFYRTFQIRTKHVQNQKFARILFKN